GHVGGIASKVSPSSGFRWYTNCCRTPIGNTAASPHFPVIAVVHSFMVHGADDRSRDDALGLPLCRIYERSGVGPLPSNAPAPLSLGVFAQRASKIFGWLVLGLDRPSPLFDDRTNPPRVVPRMLTRGSCPKSRQPFDEPECSDRSHPIGRHRPQPPFKDVGHPKLLSQLHHAENRGDESKLSHLDTHVKFDQ